MIYRIYKGEKTPDKILAYKLKEKKEHGSSKVKIRLPIFKEIPQKKEKEEEEVVIGYLTGNTTREEDVYENALIVKEEQTDDILYCEIAEKKKKLHAITGYVQVEENKYVAIQRSLFLFLLWFLGIGLLCLMLALFLPKDNDTPNKDPMKIEDGTDWDGNNPVNGKNSEASTENIDIPGYANIYLNAEAKTINLINPKGNTVYFQYTISNEEGDVLVETNLISPNKMVEKDLYSLLDKGEHTLSFMISTYDVETMELCNGAIMEVKTIIE